MCTQIPFVANISQPHIGPVCLESPLQMSRSRARSPRQQILIRILGNVVECPMMRFSSARKLFLIFVAGQQMRDKRRRVMRGPPICLFILPSNHLIERPTRQTQRFVQMLFLAMRNTTTVWTSSWMDWRSLLRGGCYVVLSTFLATGTLLI